MTAADELRQAAAKVRETAAKATPGPWERPLNTRYKHIVTAAKPDDEQGQYLDGRPERVGVVQLNIWSDGKHYRKRGGRDLEWIALMSPALAEPLAASLERMADTHRKHEADGATWCRYCAETWPCGDTKHAREVARVILGGAS